MPELPYMLPKDAREEERINFQHYLMRQLLGTHHIAPLHLPNSMLDVGCATGRWAHDMARLYPYADVVGLDVEPPRSHGLPTPPNYRFVQGNILQGLPFPEQSFDYVHQRFLVAALPSDNWMRVLRELVRVTAPYGFVELVEGSDEYDHAGPAMQQVLQWSKIATKQVGINVALVKRLDMPLIDVGLQHVHREAISSPLGKHGGRHGELFAANMLAVLSTCKDVFCKYVEGLTPLQFHKTLELLPDEWHMFHTCYTFYAFYAQKIPTTGQEED